VLGLLELVRIARRRIVQVVGEVGEQVEARLDGIGIRLERAVVESAFGVVRDVVAGRLAVIARVDRVEVVD